ncbi:group I truncated hemoglobin [Magnetococcus sp. PR-3]|uniref:group I truncated hemoglobin n=1 Tax=Magnetococcus sp. PR-3 TaxID=3120355 RepID=UPI002FCE5A43
MAPVDGVYSTNSLFERLGGEKAVSACVDLFYAKVMEDTRINHFFNQVDLAQQRVMQKNFITFAFGGPPRYSGQAMRAAHMHLVEEKGLNDSHFDAVVENLVETLKELSIDEALIKEAGAILESIRHEVLNQPAPA